MYTDYADYSYLATDYADYADFASEYATMAADEYAVVGGAMAGAFAGVAMVMSVVALIVGVLTIIANWKIFTKAGQKGWKCLIPIYNNVVLFRIAGLSPWLVLVYFASIIPVVGWIAVLGVTIYLMYNLSKAFGKDGAFTVGLVLLNTIFMMILGFGKAEYQLNKGEEVTE